MNLDWIDSNSDLPCLLGNAIDYKNEVFDRLLHGRFVSPKSNIHLLIPSIDLDPGIDQNYRWFQFQMLLFTSELTTY